MADSLRILVIDDNPDDRLLTVRELRPEFPDAEIVEVSGPEQFEHELNDRNFQLLITDYDLRWSNGFEVLKQSRKRCPDVPVIMFTGTGDQETAVRAMREGVSDYVVKSAKHRTRLRISARSALDQQRQRTILRENEKLAIIGRLMATIAHEINNPLDAVSNLLYLAEKEPEKMREYLPIARQEVARIEQITSRTLGFYRESTKPIKVNVAQILDDVMLLYQKRLQFANISVETRYEKPEVTTFPGEMRQVLSNLLVNAIDAIGQNGTIRIHVHPSGNGDRTGVRITLSDTGPGIAPEHRTRVFDPFFTTKGERGTGLGLWVTKGIVEQHGGTIRFRSCATPGRRGTCFSVFFPDESAAARAA